MMRYVYKHNHDFSENLSEILCWVFIIFYFNHSCLIMILYLAELWEELIYDQLRNSFNAEGFDLSLLCVLNNGYYWNIWNSGLPSSRR